MKIDNRNIEAADVAQIVAVQVEVVKIAPVGFGEVAPPQTADAVAP